MDLPWFPGWLVPVTCHTQLAVARGIVHGSTRVTNDTRVSAHDHGRSWRVEVAREHEGRRRALYAIGVLAPACVVLAVHAWQYLPFISDDALISLRYARRFIEGHGLTWTGGRPVEGYSNLLWVLMVSGVGWLGVDLIDGARGLGLVLSALGLAAVVSSTRAHTLPMAICALVGCLVLSLSIPVAVWAIGGLEQPLVLALLSWALVWSFPLVDGRPVPTRAIVLPSVPLALLCLTRPDGPLFAASVGLAVVLAGRLRWASVKRATLLGVLPVAAVLGQLAFRLAYYGEWIPNTARIKLVPSEKHMLGGWEYLLEGWGVMSPVLLPAAVAMLALLFDREARPRALLLAVPTAVWSIYVVVIGGDIFPAWRHFIPILVTAALAVTLAAERVTRRFPRRWGTALVVIASTTLLTTYAVRQLADETNRRAATERWEWDGQVTGLLLHRAFGDQQPLLAVDGAGCVPYWSRLPAIDMLGLNDHYIAHHPPQDLGQAQLAHAHGDGQYVWDREPDLIVFGPRGRPKARFRAGKQMQKMPGWERRYTLIRAVGRDPHRVRCRIFVHRTSDKVGIRTTDDRVVVPAYLLNGNPRTIARLNRAGDLVIKASSERPASIESLVIPPGHWSLEPQSSGPLSVDVRFHGSGLSMASGPSPLQLTVAPAGGSLDITIRGVDLERIEVSEVVLSRLGSERLPDGRSETTRVGGVLAGEHQSADAVLAGAETQ
jgi:arabinofuranosyltransferase